MYGLSGGVVIGGGHYVEFFEAGVGLLKVRSLARTLNPKLNPEPQALNLGPKPKEAAILLQVISSCSLYMGSSHNPNEI